MTFPFAAQVVLILLVVGGAIAYIGNYVGRYIGKRRLALFRLRPRHTAIAITVISGVLIAVTTMGVLLVVSQDARTAFLGLDKLKAQVSQRSQELAAANETLQRLNLELAAKLNEQKSLESSLTGARREIASLDRTRQKLSREVAVARQGDVILKKGEVVTLSLIQAGPEKEKIEAGLKQILATADAALRGYGIKSDQPLVTVDPDDFTQTVYSLNHETKVFVVRLVALRNTLWGETVPARFDIQENKLVYSEDQEIAAGEIAPRLSQPQVEQEVVRILGQARQAALTAGVLPDPSGSLGSLPYSQIADLARRIRGDRKVTLRVLAKKDIYSIGPLELNFRINYK